MICLKNDALDPSMNSSQRLILMYLASCCNDDFEASPSQKTIAKHCGMTSVSVSRNISKIIDMGYLTKTVIRHGALKISNKYKFTDKLLSIAEHLEVAGKKKASKDRFLITELNQDNYPNCQQAMTALSYLKSQATPEKANAIYTGKLHIEDWNTCEENLSAADIENIEEFVELFYDDRGQHMESISLTLIAKNLVALEGLATDY